MKKKVMSNFFWKVFSVVFATVLWFIVINIQNPIETVMIKNIPITLTNMSIINENNLLVSEKSVEVVNVRFKGKRLDVENLTENSSNIKANVDMKYYTGVGTEHINNLQIQIMIPTEYSESVKVEEQDPKYIQITLEENKEVSKKVEVEIQNKVKDGYELIKDKIKMSPEEVTIDGSARQINKIDKVKAIVDATNLSKTIKTKVTIKFYDVNGNEITDVNANTKVVSLELPVLKKKVLSLVPGTTFELTGNTTIKNIILTPATITVAGDESVIDKMGDSLSVPIDLTDVRQSKTLKQNITLPDGVEVLSGANVVTVDIVK